MPYTWEDFRRDYTREHLGLLTLDDILQRFSAEEVLQRFSADEIKAYLERLEKQQKRRKQSGRPRRT
jgi:preprotein translocase subunit Sec63